LLASLLHELPLYPILGPINVVLEVSRSASSLYIFWALAATPFLLVAAIKSRSIHALLFALGMLGALTLLIPPIAGLYRPQPPAVPGHSVRLLYANVYGPNTNYQALRTLVEHHKPDLVALLEAHEGWKNGLKLDELFPHRVELTRGYRDGKLIYSRYPLSPPELHRSKDARSMVVQLQVQRTPEDRFQFALAHAPSPVSLARLQWRSEFLPWAAGTVQDVEEPLVFALDMNSSPWTTDYENFRSVLRGTDLATGFGYQATWRPAAWIPFRVAIDHVWGKNGVQAERYEVIGDIGSDHLPLLVDLRIPGGLSASGRTTELVN
jgi:endonuclease/exonuclease/phosphatase (EEP) superfamily protein YafD